MTSAESELRATLEQLKEQLKGARTIDPQMAARLRETITEIEERLSGAAPAAPSDADDDSVGQRLTSAAQSFEATHPTLAGTVSSVIEALARMGI